MMQIGDFMKNDIHALISVSKRIWAKNAEDAVDYYFCFRREFVLETLPENSAIAIAADTEWSLCINGKRIPATQYPCYPEKKYYTVIEDLKGYLIAGKNVIAVEVHHFGWGNATHPKCPGGLRAAFIADDLKIVSDSQWKYSLSETYVSGEKQIMSIPMGLRFRYQTTPGESWKNPGFDDSSWEDAEELPLPAENGAWRELLPRPVPCCNELAPEPVHIIWQGNTKSAGSVSPDSEPDEPFLQHRLPENFFKDFGLPDWNCGERADYYPVNLTDSGSGIVILPPQGADGVSVIIDLGKEMVGYPVFQAECGNDEVSVELHYGEHLLHGRVQSRLLLARFIDTYQCGKGRVSHIYPFHRVGCRYIQLFFYGITEPFRLIYAGISETVYPVQPTAEFLCDDPVQERLRSLSARTLQLCMHEHYEDCPMREQSLYAGDSRIQMLCGYYLWGNYDFAEASLSLLGERYFEDCGYLSLCAPSDDQMTIASYSFIWISAIWEFVLFSGRKNFVAKQISRVDQILESALSRPCENYPGIYNPADNSKLFRQDGGGRVWVYYEWCGELSSDLRFPQMLHQAFLAEALECAAKLHEINHSFDKAEMYRNVKKEISAAVNRYFWSEKDGCYLEFVAEEKQELYELVQVAGITAGFADDEKKKKILHSLVVPGKYKQCSWYSMVYLAKAFMQGSLEDQNRLKEIIRNRYGFFAFNGATALWEVDTPYGGSLCHGWSALPAWYCGAFLLGVTPLEPGFRKFCFNPHADPGKDSGEIPTPYGRIRITGSDGIWQVSFTADNGKTMLKETFDDTGTQKQQNSRFFELIH